MTININNYVLNSFLRHKKDHLSSVPSFLDEVENGSKDLRAELSELQVQYVDSINELEKTRFKYI